MKRRRTIERRARIFLGCEGESEQGYGVFLQRLADEHGLRVHIVPVNLRPGGDPLALSEKAVKAYAREAGKGRFAGKVILLDADRLEEPPDRGLSALDLLRREGFTTIWQRPDHEGILLRHFAGHEHDDPPRGRSFTALQAVWPGYHKNMSARELKRILSITHVQHAAGVIPELRALLTMIGFR
jgi:hypothetical protein